MFSVVLLFHHLLRSGNFFCYGLYQHKLFILMNPKVFAILRAAYPRDFWHQLLLPTCGRCIRFCTGNFCYLSLCKPKLFSQCFKIGRCIANFRGFKFLHSSINSQHEAIPTDVYAYCSISRAAALTRLSVPHLSQSSALSSPS